MGEAANNYGKKIVLTTWTIFLWIFRSPSLLTLLVGAGLGYGMGYKLGAASVFPRAVRAEQALLEYKTQIAETIAKSKEQEVKVLNAIRARFYEKQTELEIARRNLAAARNDVRLCESTSTLSIPDPATGIDGASQNGQPRNADEVLSDIAAQIASTADEQGTRCNALIEWVNDIRQTE